MGNNLKLPKGFFRAITKCKNTHEAYTASVKLAKIEVPDTLYRLATTVSEILSPMAKTMDSIPKFETDNYGNTIKISTRKDLGVYSFDDPADYDDILAQIVEAIHKKADKVGKRFADKLIKAKIQEICERIDELETIDDSITDNSLITAWIDNHNKVLQEVQVKSSDNNYNEVRKLIDKHLMPLFNNVLKDKTIAQACINDFNIRDNRLVVVFYLQDKENAHSKEAE